MLHTNIFDRIIETPDLAGHLVGMLRESDRNASSLSMLDYVMPCRSPLEPDTDTGLGAALGAARLNHYGISAGRCLPLPVVRIPTETRPPGFLECRPPKPPDGATVANHLHIDRGGCRHEARDLECAVVPYVEGPWLGGKRLDRKRDRAVWWWTTTWRWRSTWGCCFAGRYVYGWWGVSGWFWRPNHRGDIERSHHGNRPDDRTQLPRLTKRLSTTKPARSFLGRPGRTILLHARLPLPGFASSQSRVAPA